MNPYENKLRRLIDELRIEAMVKTGADRKAVENELSIIIRELINFLNMR